MTDWQPIETAPKDCDVLFSDGYRVLQGWIAEGRPYIDANLVFDEATHWMPLPDPPKD